MKALTLQIQVKTVDLPNPFPAIKAAAVWTARLIGSVINAMLIILGIVAVGLLIISIIDPNIAGNIMAWVLHQMYVWIKP